MSVDSATPSHVLPRSSLLRTWLPLVILLSPMILAVVIAALLAWFTPNRDLLAFGLNVHSALFTVTMLNASLWVWTGRKQLTRSLMELAALSVTTMGISGVLIYLTVQRLDARMSADPALGLWQVVAIAFGMGLTGWLTYFMVRWPGWGLNQLDRSLPVSIADVFVLTTLICLGFAVSTQFDTRSHQEPDSARGPPPWVVQEGTRMPRRYASYDAEFQTINPLLQAQFYTQLGVLSVLGPPILVPVYLAARYCHYRSRHQGRFSQLLLLPALLVVVGLSIAMGTFGPGDGEFGSVLTLSVFCFVASFEQYLLLFLAMDDDPRYRCNAKVGEETASSLDAGCRSARPVPPISIKS